MLNFSSTVLAWLIVFSWSVWFGGTVYQLVVTIPEWSHALPESVINWNGGQVYPSNPGNLFIPAANVFVISTILLLILSWTSETAPRLWICMALVCGIVLFLMTVIFFFPLNESLLINHGKGLSNEEITNGARRWIMLNYIRAAIGITGYISSLLILKKY